MKIKTAHTPTYFLKDQYLCEQDAQSGNTIADIRADDDVRQMILRAVNCHEELIKLVITVQRLAMQKGNTELMRRCKEAIAKAEGK